MRVLKYIKGCPGIGIFFSSTSLPELVAYCDASYDTCPMSRRSTTGYCLLLRKSLVSWTTKKQSVVSRSSAEAEYRAMADTACEIVWMIGLFGDLGVVVPRPISLHCDNEAAAHIAANPVFHARTKHIEIDCHFVRDKVQEGMICMRDIRTKEQPADLLTKALGSSQHQHLLSKLGVFDLHQP